MVIVNETHSGTLHIRNFVLLDTPRIGESLRKPPQMNNNGDHKRTETEVI